MRALLLWVSILAIAGVAARASGTPARSKSKDRVIQVEVLIEGNSVSILSSGDATIWTEESLPQKPRITRETWRKIEHDQSELLVVLHDENGKVLRTYAYPGRYVAFLEAAPASAHPGLPFAGGFASPSSNVRMLVLPIPAKTMFLSFYRTEVRHESVHVDPAALNPERFDASTFERNRNRDRLPGGEFISFGWSLLGTCPVPRPLGDRPPKPIDLEIPRILEVPDFPRDPPPKLLKKLRPEIPFEGPYVGTLCAPGAGTVTGHVQLHAAIPFFRIRPYNIVIFGDGFTGSTADVAEYQRLATLAADAFRTTPPFSDHFSNINLWRIDTECPDSGVANCPGTPLTTCPNTLATAETYYRISGCMPSTRGVAGCNPSYAGYVGPRALCPLDIAAEQELPGVYVDLRLVIANCELYGAAAYPADRLVVITRCVNCNPVPCDPDIFAEVLLHETAHTVGKVCDEYWVCVKWEGETFPNFATLEQVNADDVPWQALDPSWPQNRHVRGVAPCSASGADHNSNPCAGTVATLSPSLHGAFFGCQFIDPDSVVSSICCNWGSCAMDQSTLASPYFRPSPQCKMKELRKDFCFVCSEAIRQRIENPLTLISLP